MKPKAIVLSGQISAGKSTLARELNNKAGAVLIKSKDLIEQRHAESARGGRASLQRAGQRLDRTTDGAWLSESVNRLLLSNAPPALVVIDSARIATQVHHLRQSGWAITHVHLTASQQTLSRRYKSRSRKGEFKTYDELSKNWTEKHVVELAKIADVVIDTDRCNAKDVFARVMARLESRPTIAPPLVDVLIGGQYGSEGKGNIANYLAPEYDVLVRVGGPNAGHKVFRADDTPFTFHQLPSGALANKSATLVIGAGAVISLERLRSEIGKLSIEYDKLIIDPQAMIIDKKDIEWEINELRDQIASTAQGVGHATARKILERKISSSVLLAGNEPALKHYIRDSVEFFAECLSSGKKIMLEGTQGTSLSLHHGNYPHVTSRVTSATGCLAEAGISARHVRRVLMVCRTYPIRVGDTDTGNTSGFMSQEISLTDVSKRSNIPLTELQSTERTSTTNRKRRIAEFDWAQLRRSLILNGPTDIALTFVDYLSINNRNAYRYEQLTDETLRFVEEIEKVSGISVSLLSTAFNDRNIIDRRNW